MTAKKILSILICLVMVLSLMPMAAFATEEVTAPTGPLSVQLVDNGLGKRPSVIVTCDGEQLSSDDYMVVFSRGSIVDTNNFREPGTVVATVQGLNRYASLPTATASFTIAAPETEPANADTTSDDGDTSGGGTGGGDTSGGDTSGGDTGSGDTSGGGTSGGGDAKQFSVKLTPKGEGRKPQVTVMDGDKQLTENTDYRVNYNRDGRPDTLDFTSVGTVYVVVTGLGDYAGTEVTKEYKIEATTPPVDPPVANLSVALVSPSATYNGAAQSPSIASVTFGGNTLTGGENGDYTVQYLRGTAETTDFTSAGIITVMVKGSDNSSYKDKTGFANFTIEKKTLTVTAKPQSVEYGKTIVQGEYEQSGLITSPVHTLSVNLVADTTKGTITPVVTAITANNAGNSVIGNYDIKPVDGTLTIIPREVTTPKITLDRTSYGYTGKEVKPTVTAVYDGSTLIPATEYTVAYENNVNLGTGTVKIVDNAGGNYAVSGYTTFSIVNNVKYNVVLGNGGCWYRGSYYGLGFRCDGPYSDFIGLTIDGQGVDRSYYAVSEGSTNVGLYPQTLNMLGNGTHYITFHYTSGSATGVFYVGSTAINAVMTGDDSNVGLLALVMCLGVLSSVTILSVLRKRKSGA